MTELQSAIEAAGLPAVEFDYPRLAYRWQCGRFEIQLGGRPGAYRAKKYDGWLVVADVPCIPTAAEACAQVKEWMDE